MSATHQQPHPGCFEDGSFVKEFFFEKNTLGNGAVWISGCGPIRIRASAPAPRREQRNPHRQARRRHRGRSLWPQRPHAGIPLCTPPVDVSNVYTPRSNRKAHPEIQA